MEQAPISCTSGSPRTCFLGHQQSAQLQIGEGLGGCGNTRAVLVGKPLFINGEQAPAPNQNCRNQVVDGSAGSNFNVTGITLVCDAFNGITAIVSGRAPNPSITNRNYTFIQQIECGTLLRDYLQIDFRPHGFLNYSATCLYF